MDKLSQKYLRVITLLSQLAPSPHKTHHTFSKLQRILSAHHSPQQAHQKFIHVTGTNGKGSVAMKIAKGLELSRYKTGLFVSPHLFSFTERLRVNSQPIPKHRFVQMFYKVEPWIKKEGLSFFQVLTLMGFLYFQEEKCSKVVLEVGIGGTLDTTNIITAPIVTVATTIGLDHSELLGNTIESVAKNKAGIMKVGRPMVIGSGCQPRFVFQQNSKLLNCPLIVADKTSSDCFEDYNNNIVSKVFQVLQTQGINIANQAKQQALISKQQCRKQYIPQNLLLFSNQQQNNRVVLDVGHNPPALLKLFQTLRQNHPESRFIVIYGTSKVKDSEASINNINLYAEKIYLVEAKHFRAKDIETLRTDTKGFQKAIIVQQGDVQRTIKYALQHCKHNETIVVCGSFFLMREAKGYFYPKEIDERADPETRPKQQK